VVHNKFFNTVFEESNGEYIRIEPSEYVRTLHPHKAMRELSDFIESLTDELSRYTDSDMRIPERVGEVRNMAFELHLAQNYLAHLEENYSTIH
jgi:hypothetical protein